MGADWWDGLERSPLGAEIRRAEVRANDLARQLVVQRAP